MVLGSWVIQLSPVLLVLVRDPAKGAKNQPLPA